MAFLGYFLRVKVYKMHIELPSATQMMQNLLSFFFFINKIRQYHYRKENVKNLQFLFACRQNAAPILKWWAHYSQWVGKWSAISVGICDDNDYRLSIIYFYASYIYIYCAALRSKNAVHQFLFSCFAGKTAKHIRNETRFYWFVLNYNSRALCT